MMQMLASYISLLLKKAWALCLKSPKNRTLFAAFCSLLVVIFASSLHKFSDELRFLKPQMGEANLEKLLHETRISAIDLDPLTYQSLHKDILSLTNGEDENKNRLFRQYLKDEQREAVENMIDYARTLPDQEKPTQWRQIAALTFFLENRTSERHYKKIIEQHDRTPEMTYQLAVIQMLQQKNRDSAALFKQFINLPQNKNTAYEAASYGNLGIIALREKDVQLAEYYILRSLQLNTKLKRQKAIALQHANLGIVALNKGKPRSARLNFNRALERFAALGETENIARVRNTLGELELQSDRQQAAQQHFQASYEAYRSIGDNAKAADQLLLLGRNAYLLEQRPQAQKYFEEALRLNLTLNRKGQIADLYTRLGLIYAEDQKSNQACHYWSQALKALPDATPQDFSQQLEDWRKQLNCPGT